MDRRDPSGGTGRAGPTNLPAQLTRFVGRDAERLDNRFELLTAGARTALPRHQTLRAAVAWSYDLLDEVEQQMLRGLSVFSGGFTLDAAEAVRGGHDEAATCAGLATPRATPPPCRTIPDLVARLVDRSLVLVENPCGRARYRLLETIRQFGLDRLREADEEPIVRRRHADWLVELANRAEPALRGPDQGLWIERLEAEHDNLRAALAWVIEHGEVEAGLRLTRGAWRFWSYRGYLTEGRRWLEAVLALAAQAAPSPMLADAQFAAGRLAHQQGAYDAARAWFLATLATAEAVGHGGGVVGARTQLGHLAMNDRQLQAAREQYELALTHRAAVGDTGEVAVALVSLGFVHQLSGAAARARRLFEEGLRVVERLGDRSLQAYVLACLGELALDEGRRDEARDLLTASLQIYHALGARLRLAGVLEGLAMLAAAEGRAAQALRLAGAAAALRDAVDGRPTPREASRARPSLEHARRQLGERAAAEALAEGRGLSLGQAIEEALTPGAATRDRRRPAGSTNGCVALPSGRLTRLDTATNRGLAERLTSRESEVAVLVARGLTNRQIGEALVITEGTASLHVKHILGKLGFSNRTQIARWVAMRDARAAAPAVRS